MAVSSSKPPRISLMTEVFLGCLLKSRNVHAYVAESNRGPLTSMLYRSSGCEICPKSSPPLDMCAGNGTAISR